MALRLKATREMLAFHACRDALADEELLLAQAWGNEHWCPRHHSQECVEVYLAGRHLQRWSAWHFRRWRGRRVVDVS